MGRQDTMENSSGRELAPPQRAALAPAAALSRDPFVLYMAALRSPRSRATMASALGRAARIFDAFDRGGAAADSPATAAAYQWGALGALTYAKAAATVALIDEEGHANMARLALAGLRGIARQAFNLGLLSGDDRMKIDDIRTPKLSGERRGRALSDDELAALAALFCRDQSPAGVRDAAIIAAMVGAGLRRAEVAALDRRDYERIDGACILIVRSGKGGKFARAPAPADVGERIDAWLEIRGGAEGTLWWASPGRGRPLRPSRMSASGIYRMVALRARAAGIAPAAPHDLRRTFVTRFLARTGDLALAQQAARHASAATTGLYDKRGEAALLRAFAAARSGF